MRADGTLTVYATSDLHAHVQRPDGGIAAVAAHIRGAGSERSLWIDNGDTLSGSAVGAFLSGRAEDHPILPALEDAGLDVGVPGNHDFDHGAAVLARRASALRRAAYVCANVRTAAGETLFPPSTVLDRAGLRIGIIGAVTGHLQRLTRYDAVVDVTVADPLAAVTAEAERLRGDVDVLLLSYHGGFEADPVSGRPTQYDTGEDQAARLLASVPGLDGLIAGHQHRVAAGVAPGATGPVAYVQPGYAGERIGVLRFTVSDGAVVSRSAETVVPAAPADAVALTAEHAAARRWLDTASGLDEDAIHRIVGARTGASVTVLQLPGGSPTWAELSAALPPPYGVERYRMPRAELAAALARAPEGVSVRGLDPDPAGWPLHVDVVASAALRGGLLPEGRVQDARPYDWLDELVTTAG
ncbi:metallophosphoesterase [Microbacterium album]|uniref:Calcineurin-like phosphoesterase domain-containing protein n=1 Tax=Microbacterium album TaxID=2053191 RepID=A0A917MK42_9MICO|nr:metallophosphoesterase [Microbacterium album]GGH34459.1 hypothetical protein GCM10010921_02190 [Microbacterium album]